MRILLAGEDARLGVALAAALRDLGYAVDRSTGMPTVAEVAAVQLVLLMVGDDDGADICRELRLGSDVGIILLTNRSDERSRVAGLHAGADDCLIQPVSLLDLHARVDAVLRRIHRQSDPVYQLGPLEVRVDRHEAVADDVRLTLTRKEFQLLVALIREPGVVQHREELLQQVWQTSWSGRSRTVDVHVGTLRNKLASTGVAVETVRGVGYRLVTRCRDSKRKG
ncbi:winged helix-turn-helix domain-containing protein [Actinoplanes sp. NPDC051859]|uniref:winged helix-turn-helix domain-containing protein n=1 Tax=Actinoplanes sp. NPDC051859 TaxID=3363909 RepID=UPI00378D228D